jgi:hypothetical protein
MNILNLEEVLQMRERHAEQYAISFLRKASFTARLSALGMVGEQKVMQGKRPLTVHGRDLYNQHTWHKFTKQQPTPLTTYPLTTLSEPLAKQYQNWLLTQFTPRYRLLTSAEHLTWLEQVCMLVVIDRLMEHKYEHLGFADPWAAAQMSFLLQLRMVGEVAAPIVKQMLKEKEQIPDLMDQFWAGHARQIAQQMSTVREALPPLPAGMTAPFPLLALQAGEEV